MKKFVLHTLLFSSLLVSIFLLIFLQADGSSGPYYLKVSSPKQQNMIFGISKGAQGIQPEVLSKTINKPFYNFSFAIDTSPYGSIYLRAIKRKLDTSAHNNTYLLAVDIWSLSVDSTSLDDTTHFREQNSFISKIKSVTQYPNLEYLIKHNDYKYYTLLSNNSPAFLHDNGWLEVNLDEDSASIQRRTDFTLSTYEHKAKTYHFSPKRFSYLIKTIEYLKSYGQVYLLQLPVHPELMKIENQVERNFQNQIQPAIDLAEAYLDLSPYNQNFNYTDGAHLNKESGQKVSQMIAEWLQVEMKN